MPLSEVIPTLLAMPPNGDPPSPPVTTREQGLPFAELTWVNFERLLLRLVRTQRDIIECASYGTPGQKQEGIDILATGLQDAALRTCFQCKKVESFPPSAIKGAVTEFMSGQWAEQSSEFVLCVAIPLSTTKQQDEIELQRKRLAASNIKLTVWDGAPAGALCELLKRSPELVDDFFGRPWVSMFNGIESAVRLPDRLNGYEIDALRQRLSELYRVVFAQHDPGLGINRDQTFNYLERYVPADVVESTEVVSSAELAPAAAARDPARSDGVWPSEPVKEASSGSVSSYEARSPVLHWLRDQSHCLILGEPGYGKSALLRHVALSTLLPDIALGGTLRRSDFSRVPVWISFARWSAHIQRHANASLGDFFTAWLHQHSFDAVIPLFERAVKGKQILLLVDGLDEAGSDAAASEAMSRLLTFTRACDGRVICTSRPRGHQALAIPGDWARARLMPLSRESVLALAERWFSVVEPAQAASATSRTTAFEPALSRANAFLRAASDNTKTFELARNPLLCQALLQLFRSRHRLPEARVTAYEQIIELLLSTHPAARALAGGVQAPISGLCLLPGDFKEIALQLAWLLQTRENADLLTRQQCEECCAAWLADDHVGLGKSAVQARRDAPEVVEKLLNQFGLLVERAPGEFGFVHLSLQEYLAAETWVRLPAEDQSARLQAEWLQPRWRETLISWFGLLGARGDRALAIAAAQQLRELGEQGEWQRTQSLLLRTEIATSDLGLPVVEARRTVDEATQDIETSPYSALRMALARHITLGATGSAVKGECEAAIRRWMPGRSAYVRLELLNAFKTWAGSDVLENTLVRALHDEDSRCRRAASLALAQISRASVAPPPILVQLAMHHVLPEVRAAALHGVASIPAWSKDAERAATANIGSGCGELALTATQVRVRQRVHNHADLECLWRLWTEQAVDYWLRDEMTELFCIGWPQHQGLRRTFLERLAAGRGPADVDLPLEYLIRSYPGDVVVADAIAMLLATNGSHFSAYPERLWAPMREGFRGDVTVSTALRAMLTAHREKYEAIFWHPSTVPAYAVIGDDGARDDLLASYESADLRGRYWIASTLLLGWRDDAVVQTQLRTWAAGEARFSKPLAEWGSELVPDAETRRAWLLKLAGESAAIREIDAIVALLTEFPDATSQQLCELFMVDERIWYYHRLRLQTLYANAFPERAESLNIVDRALSELDGPNPGALAGAFEANAAVAIKLLAASVTAPRDVRMTVARVLRERAPGHDIVIALTPCPYADEVAEVRTSCLVARAQAARSQDVDVDNFSRELQRELGASGGYHAKRRLSALAALIELGCHEQAVASLDMKSGASWRYILIDSIDQDAVALTVVLASWPQLQPAMRQRNLEHELPIRELVHYGFAPLLEQVPYGREELDKYLLMTEREWINSAYLEVLARRQTGESTLALLIALAEERHRYGAVSCTSARLLAQHFSSLSDIATRLSVCVQESDDAFEHRSPGVLGHYVLGWPNGNLAMWVNENLQSLLPRLSILDQLLVAVATKNVAAAEQAVVAMLSRRFSSWAYRNEDVQAIRIWMHSGMALESVDAWLTSGEGNLAATALSILGETGGSDLWERAALVKRLNEEVAVHAVPPGDGVDAADGRHTSWAVRMYAALDDAHAR